MTYFALSAKQRRNVSIATLSTIAVIGIASIVFKTYPHLKPSFLCGHADDKPAEDSQLSDSTVVVDKKINEWTDEELKTFLKEKEVTVPESATHSDLVALAEQIQSQ
ncbi:DEKNAAE103418 [Brettanomyces naardenensis]|uniref:DEKNAAE103418 n=1 Tax=Brettanomyces naardenensis TaxID=13370 RepID=A0A448YNH1_BRENA|nr:DEKNAAE103418 [Brettanomyces naardenensis]